MKPVCPRCKSVNVKRIFLKEKKLFWAILDLFLGDYETEYYCKNCEYKFTEQDQRRHKNV